MKNEEQTSSVAQTITENWLSNVLIMTFFAVDTFRKARNEHRGQPSPPALHPSYYMIVIAIVIISQGSSDVRHTAKV